MSGARGRTSLAAMLLAGTAISHAIAAPSPDEIRRAFADIRDDKIKHNCEHATEWLLKCREEIKDDLLAELYRTDYQGRDAIFHVLFNTASFQPDERFIRFLMARMPEANHHVASDTIFKDQSGRLPVSGAAWEAWFFINDRYAQFEPYLKEEVGKTDSPFYLWAAAWLAKTRGVMAEYAPLYTPEILSRVAVNLKSDNEGSNASQTVRLYLLLGDQSVSALQEITRSGDSQAVNLAKATLDALKGKRRAFGYLNAKVYLTSVLFGSKVGEPGWLDELTEPFAHNDLPYE
jgi:hypothetical protein